MLKKILLLALMSLLVPQISSAATVRFDVTLDSSTNSTGSPGTGSATAFFDTSNGMMSISGMFSGLNGNSTIAHLHGFTTSAGTGTAGVKIPLSFPSGNGMTSGTIAGSGTISGDDSSFSATLGGKTYINIHSSVNTGGEIRGFLSNAITVPEPGSFAALCVFAAGAAMKRRRRRYV